LPKITPDVQDPNLDFDLIYQKRTNTVNETTEIHNPEYDAFLLQE
jgi:hypothetical protein